MKKQYDYLVVGAGPFGSVFAYEANKRGKQVLVIDRRPTAGGNMYCDNIEGINVHTYGAHIFHTSNREIWEYVSRFCAFNRYINSPIANYRGEIYNLPFNMNTFNRMWGVVTPAEARAKIADQVKSTGITKPENLEEQALVLVGPDIYYKLIKGYTEKQWGRDARDLPAFIIKRLPLRFTYDNNYFDDIWQGIPVGGYNVIFSRLLADIELRLDTDYFDNRDYFDGLADKTVFTGMIDEYFGYTLGTLEYRSLRFEHEVLDTDNYQGNAVINYTEREIPYTRIIEHKHFEFGTQPKTVITREYPAEWKRGDEPYYPVNDDRNSALYGKYRDLAAVRKNVIFGGRLADYRYYDMHHVFYHALEAVKKEFGT